MQYRHYLALVTAILAVLFLVSTEPVIAKSEKGTAAKTTEKVSQSSTTSKSAKKVSGKININTADVKQLTQITGIGPKTAQKIIDYRKKNGKFKSMDDLLNVKGIGEKTLKKIRSQIKL